ncbi:MAG: hypothetical protein HFI12_05165 [Lachnospiraceae bacterium]|jgi:hypothetical protein|nr:hypothetical protein [Lachnospiraceae bacterium]
MKSKNTQNVVVDIRKTHYSNLKQQQYALNMQIRLAMQTYDVDMKIRLEKELKEINEEIRYLGG